MTVRTMDIPDAPAAALVLFDIDGTLIRKAGPHHRQALVEAARRVTGLETTTENIPVQGMLDRDILGIMLANAGASRGLVRRSMDALARHGGDLPHHASARSTRLRRDHRRPESCASAIAPPPCLFRMA